MTEEELKVILEKHKLWFDGKEGGERADLSGANLSGADLSGANLSKANLSGANLSEADLSGANLFKASLSWASLSWANLSWANLSWANLSKASLSWANLSEANLSKASLSWASLSWANLSKANLSGANLSKANLSGANLSEADLSKANLSGANLSKANLSGATTSHFQTCPEEGSFIGWKKLRGDVVAKLLIPEDAKRTSTLVGRKCRAEFVKVLELSGEAYDKHSGMTLYVKGKTVYPDKYDDDIRVECTHGIHFFMTRKEAEEY